MLTRPTVMKHFKRQRQQPQHHQQPLAGSASIRADSRATVLFVPRDETLRDFACEVKSNNKRFRFELKDVDDDGSLTHAQALNVHCRIPEQEDMELHISGATGSALRRSADVTALERELSLEMSRLAVPSREVGKLARFPTARLYSIIMRDLSQVGWHHVQNIDPTFRTVTLRVADSASRPHLIKATFSDEYPRVPPQVNLALPLSSHEVNIASSVPRAQEAGRQDPCQPTLKWTRGATSMSEAVDQVLAMLEHYQEFWNQMDDLDQNVWVMEPKHPNRADCHRRIVVQQHCSLHLLVSPTAPRALCQCTFIGPDRIVEPLREKWHSSSSQWNTSLSVRSNLEALLGVTFPQKSVMSDFGLECGICYCYRLSISKDADGVGNTSTEGAPSFPDITCESCGQHFHAQCIVNWLQSIPSTRRSFNSLFGSCPYCTKPLSVSA